MAIKRKSVESPQSPSKVDASRALANVRAYLRRSIKGLDGSELDDLTSKSVTRALAAWVPSKGAFPTFAVGCAKNDAKNYLKERTRERGRQGEMPADVSDDEKGGEAESRYSSPDELWRAVRKFCLEAFEETHGRAWEERFAATEVDPGEEAARVFFQNLRSAARVVAGLPNDYPATTAGPCWQYLCWLREQQRLLFFHMSNSDPDPWPPTGATPADRRARIAWLWTCASPIRATGASSTSFGIGPNGRLEYSVASDDPSPSNRTLAVVSLLSGIRPDVAVGPTGAAVAEVLAIEADNMRKARARHGQRAPDKK